MVGLLFRKKAKPQRERKKYDYTTTKPLTYRPPSYTSRPRLNAERSRKYYTPVSQLKYKRSPLDYRTSSSSRADKAVIAKRVPRSTKKPSKFTHTKALGGRLRKRASSYKSKRFKFKLTGRKRKKRR